MATAAGGSTASRIGSLDDPLDEVAVWRNIQVELQRLADIRDMSDDIILTLDKVPEGEYSYNLLETTWAPRTIGCCAGMVSHLSDKNFST